MSSKTGSLQAQVHDISHITRNYPIRSSSVISAFSSVDRKLFVNDSEKAYQDTAILLKSTDDGTPLVSSTQPSLMALMLDFLNLSPEHRVLEIGSGSGYNACLMSSIVGRTGRVISVDIDEFSIQHAKDVVARNSFQENIEFFLSDGYEGYQPYAQYDRIIVTAQTSFLPYAWIQQLSVCGRLMVPFCHKGLTALLVLDKLSADKLEGKFITICGFMPLRSSNHPPSRSFTTTLLSNHKKGLYSRRLHDIGSELSSFLDVWNFSLYCAFNSTIFQSFATSDAATDLEADLLFALQLNDTDGILWDTTAMSFSSNEFLQYFLSKYVMWIQLSKPTLFNYEITVYCGAVQPKHSNSYIIGCQTSTINGGCPAILLQCSLAL